MNHQLLKKIQNRLDQLSEDMECMRSKKGLLVIKTISSEGEVSDIVSREEWLSNTIDFAETQITNLMEEITDETGVESDRDDNSVY
ncbi:MAG: hypothetical protein K0S80_3227 [Neobacillus sp.]|jgi:hypothetical protein|nr:hypothetical protein [Neobacillus sp.]